MRRPPDSRRRRSPSAAPRRDQATPGHAADHVSFVLDDGERRVVFLGDAAYSQDNLLAGRVDGISPKAAIARATLARFAALAAERPTMLALSHEPDVPARLARGESAPVGVAAPRAASSAPKRLATPSAPC